MKILILNWQDINNPLGGGAEVHMQEIFSRIVKRGHSVTLYCSNTPGSPKEEVIDGVKVIHEGGRYFFNFYVLLRYFTRFRKEGYDIVIDDMNKIPFFTPLFVRRPLVILIHHLFDKSIFKEAPFPLALYVFLMEKMAIAACRISRTPVFVVSESTKKEVGAKGIPSDRMSIVPNCVDHTRYRSLGIPRSDEPLIGYFGRLKKYKSVEHLLEALVGVRKSVPKVKLVIIGDGDYRATLESKVKELGLSDCVRFTGYVDETEKVKLLNQVWFLVNTSAKEGWGLTVIESNACATTVVASNVPGLRDSVKDGETGLMYEYGNVEELSEKILLLLNDQSMRERLSANAEEWARLFDWQVVADQSISTMEQIIKDYPAK